MTRTDPATTKIIDALDSFYCYNLTAALWGRWSETPGLPPNRYLSIDRMRAGG